MTHLIFKELHPPKAKSWLSNEEVVKILYNSPQELISVSALSNPALHLSFKWCQQPFFPQLQLAYWTLPSQTLWWRLSFPRHWGEAVRTSGCPKISTSAQNYPADIHFPRGITAYRLYGKPRRIYSNTSVYRKEKTLKLYFAGRW